MSQRLIWDRLLCGDRVRVSSTIKNVDKKDKNYDHRNEFDKDYDRIVYSSSVRRLQDKAQVFPLQENDFTRTRLTHSLEASALGRSFGNAIGQWLLEKGEFNKYNQTQELASLLQVSALIHDLGNPPFGHYGEDIIREWFRKFFENGNKKQITDELTKQQKEDFLNFEGNAQTLRIVSKLQLLNDQYGVNFTYATLSTIMKYPWKSDSEQAKDKKKFAYFASENELAKKIFEKVGLEQGVRHPATYLLEASDDIAYLLADLEDAVKKRIIPWEKEYNKMKDNLLKSNKNEFIYGPMFKYLDNQQSKNERNKIPESNMANIQNFKVRVQGLMFKKVVEVFKSNYNEIMSGEYGIKNLLEESELIDLINEIKRLGKKYCYTNKEVLTLELVGDKVINGLLDMFINSLIGYNKQMKPKTKEGKLFYLISDNFKYICCLNDEKNSDGLKEYKIETKDFKDIETYKKLLLITDFISGMTDSYAVNLYKELFGVKLP